MCCIISISGVKRALRSLGELLSFLFFGPSKPEDGKILSGFTKTLFFYYYFLQRELIFFRS